MSSISTIDAADYVIIGGGTAGLVLASRLSENPNLSVVVLEAGKNHLHDPRVNIPAFGSSLVGTELDWQFASCSQVREDYCADLPLCTLIMLLVAGTWRSCNQNPSRKASRRIECSQRTNSRRAL
jgi:hypothetical protein